MGYRLALIGVLVGGVAGAATGDKPGVIEAKADAALHRMSDYLASLESFRVHTSTVDETKVDKNGQRIQTLGEAKVAVRRPGQMRLDRVSANGRIVFRDDGTQLSIYHSDTNTYATAPAPAKLDQAANEARTPLQIDSPGVDLLATNPYQALTEGATGGRYVGLEPIGGVMAHHLAVSKKNVDYQIWIEDGPEPLPLRYVVAAKDMRGSGQFSIQLSNWQPHAAVPDDSFTFIPPAGAKKVAFAPPHKG